MTDAWLTVRDAQAVREAEEIAQAEETRPTYWGLEHLTAAERAELAQAVEITRNQPRRWDDPC